MATTLYWLSCGGCGGDTLSLLNSNSPDLFDFLEMFDIKVLWHPSLSTLTAQEHGRLLRAIQAGDQRLDVLCVEGAVLKGPGGTGSFDFFGGKPKKDLLSALARQAGLVLAVGTCASFGGMGSADEVEGTGLQFNRGERGGFLGADFVSGSGLPVINLPGCPCHGNVLIGALMNLQAGKPLPLDNYHSPLEWYGTLVHQGCTRNEYHEYRVEEEGFGERGCLFFHLGCHGPLVYGPCNKLLWNQRSSKTRVGVPCFGCTRPDFPQPYPFFETRNIEGIPLELPDGIDRAHYMAYKGLAAAAAPQRLKRRETKV